MRQAFQMPSRTAFTATWISACFAAGITSAPALAVTRIFKKDIPYTKALKDLRPSLAVPITEKVESLPLPNTALLSRINGAAKDERIEPVAVSLKKQAAQLDRMASQLARIGKKEELLSYLNTRLMTAKPVIPDSPWMRVELDPKAVSLINLNALSKLLAKSQRVVEIPGARIKANPRLLDALMDQLKDYIDGDGRQAILRKVASGQIISLSDDLLPEFARKYVGRFISFRGPNCFHAALAFQGTEIPKSAYINVKEETGYHRAMINYDELWRFIQTSFYEVDPRLVPMKYGDLLVFYELGNSDPSSPVDFRNIRHTTTYLFNNLAFSKGSKSADTPYTIKTMQEEWQTWKKITKNLGAKVFRKKQTEAQTKPVVDLVDWIY